MVELLTEAVEGGRSTFMAGRANLGFAGGRTCGRDRVVRSSLVKGYYVNI